MPDTIETIQFGDTRQSVDFEPRQGAADTSGNRVRERREIGAEKSGEIHPAPTTLQSLDRRVQFVDVENGMGWMPAPVGSPRCFEHPMSSVPLVDIGRSRVPGKLRTFKSMHLY